jgi:hypothetical protein
MKENRFGWHRLLIEQGDGASRAFLRPDSGHRLFKDTP